MIRTYIDNPVTALDWDHMDKAGTVDGNYVNYSGFVYYNNTNGDFDQSFNGDTVNGTISTYYLNHDYADSTANQLDISNSVIHGSITSMLLAVIMIVLMQMVIIWVDMIFTLMRLLIHTGVMVMFSL